MTAAASGVAVALRGPFERQVAQIGVGPLLVGPPVNSSGTGNSGSAGHAELDLDVRPLRDQQGVVTRFGDLGEQLAHLRGRLQVVLLAVELETLGVVDERAGLHAQQGVVGHGVLAVRVVAVVGGEERRADAPGDADQRGIGPRCSARPWSWSSTNRLSRPKMSCRRPASRGLLVVAGQQRLEHHPAEAPGGGDDALVVALEQLPVDPRLVVVALEVGGRRQLEQVLVARRWSRPAASGGSRASRPPSTSPPVSSTLPRRTGRS